MRNVRTGKANKDLDARRPSSSSRTVVRNGGGRLRGLEAEPRRERRHGGQRWSASEGKGGARGGGSGLSPVGEPFLALSFSAEVVKGP